MTTGAEDDALAGAAPAPAKQMSMLFFMLILLVLTAAAGGAGFLGGLQILAHAERAIGGKAGEQAGAEGGQHAAEAANLKPLAPIVTNLSGSPPVWIRLESTLVFREEVPSDAEALAARITEDIVGFLRTTAVEQIEGATGFQHLSEDLNDRVRVRSNGHVRELIIQGLIVE